MHLLDLFESTVEGYTVTRGIDRDRYQERAGLEGPFQTKSGKVVYYDKKEGQYYDPDSDMYIDHDDYRALDEADNAVEQSKIEQIVINNDIVPGIKKLMDVLAYDEATARREAESITKHVARHRWNKMTPQERADAIAKNKSSKSQMATDFKKVASKFGEEVELDEAITTAIRLTLSTDKNYKTAVGIIQKYRSQGVMLGTVKTKENTYKILVDGPVPAMRKLKKEMKQSGIKFMATESVDLDEGVGTYLKGAVLAGLLGLGINQMADMASAKNSPLGQAMAQAAEQGDKYAAKHLKKLDLYMDANDTGSIKILSKKYLNKTIESVYEEVATNKKTERILGLLRAKNPTAQNDLEALILSFEKGQRQDREDINTLYTQNREEDREIEALERELERIKKRRNVSEDYYETDEQRELARLGRIIMDMGAKRDDAVGAAMGAVGNELTKYGTPQGASNMRKLEQLTGQPESVIMKMMALAQKVQGDVAVGDETAGNNDEEEVKETLRKVPYAGYKGPGSDFRAYDEPDQRSNWVVKVGGKKWKVFANEKTARKAAYTVQQKYGKDTEVYATMDPVSEGAAKDFDDKFRKNIDLYTKSQSVRDYRAKKAQMNLDQMKATDPGNINPLIIDKPKAHSKARKAGVSQRVITTNQNRKLPEAVETDIQVGDTVQTLKMGQMKGTVTGFSKKSGITKVLFKHESGKTYATVPENLKVIDKINEGGFFDPDQPNPGDMVKHRNGAVGKVKTISTQDNETWINFKGEDGEMYFGQWKKHVFPMDTDESVDEASRPTKMYGKDEKSRFPKTVNIDDFDLSSMYDHRSVDQLYQSLNVANNAIQKETLKIEKLQDAGKRPVKTQQALEVLKRKRDYIADLIKQKEMQDESIELDEAKKKPVPTNPELWSRAKAAAKQKYDVWPSAYSSAFAAKWYKEKGGGWRMGNPKK